MTVDELKLELSGLCLQLEEVFANGFVCSQSRMCGVNINYIVYKDIDNIVKISIDDCIPDPITIDENTINLFNELMRIAEVYKNN